jgi:hypothetical protein
MGGGLEIRAFVHYRKKYQFYRYCELYILGEAEFRQLALPDALSMSRNEVTVVLLLLKLCAMSSILLVKLLLLKPHCSFRIALNSLR